MHSGFLGLSSDEDYIPFDVVGDEEVSGEDSYDIDDDVTSETWLILNSSFKLENSEHPDEITRPSFDDIIPHPQVQQDSAEINEGDDVTPCPQGVDIDIAAALKRAASTAWAEKTKNSSNKNKECTLISSAIVKLLEQYHPLSNNQQSNNQQHNEQLAMMAITLMHQMKTLNKSMDDHDRHDRKRHKKKHAKKCAKKHTKKVK